MKTLKLIALILSALGIQFVQAQSKTLKAMDDIATTGAKVKGLFENKNSSAKANDGKNTNQESSPKARMKSGGLNPGDVMPDAKTLEYDELGPFNGGAAIVKKGTAYALIDAKGNIVVPFNKYKLVSTLEGIGAYNLNVCFSGFFQYDSIGFAKVMNAQGRHMSGKATFSRVTKDGKYALHYLDLENKLVFIDNIGNSIIIPRTFKKSGYGTVNSPEYFNDDLGVARLDNGNMPAGLGYTYMNVKNKTLFMHRYEVAEDFSEGLACVGKRDESGVIKYGFIDRKGNLVIPCSYTNKPTNFSCGLSQVTPKDQNEYKTAFINKKGEIVIKCTDIFTEFRNGYSYSARVIMDTTGKQYKPTDYFAKLGISVRAPQNVWIIDADKAGRIHDGKMRFQKTFRADAPEGQNTAGYFDLKTQKTIGFNFTYNGDSQKVLWFDPVSKLAYAERYLGKDNSGNVTWRKGYINEDGVFIMLKGESSKW